ncbi:hypothetical protein LJJ44_08985 [Pseudomonas sp. B24_DOA]|uniref:hypothetical protein n=1 Tax=Pseudomonas siliginis TaxID=2842346 RepID=UPI001C3C57D2|nr:hypothetical protein [Pseudomonas siliginis]MBV4469331.1 hypothetical protein [Pseudomonas siliginis]WKV85995.1 hypothetical protein LJJ44_08985 [Pseudomonas sp. B24_DOA]WKV87422.1 hypothetical protein LJU32_17015 [Pseudomonas sp. B21_DOA]
MSIDKQKLQKLLWAEAASYRADCADWKRNTEALQDFLGEKTVEEVALELLAENNRLGQIEYAFSEWIEKTDWVQSTVQASELGRHRADVLRTRIDQFKAENEALRKAIADVDGALEREYWSEYAGLEEARSILDAAIGKAAQA